ncbi:MULTISPECIES: SDR family oxidoreductase [unclassified Pseudoalteromonas]|uniref:dTDP-4-dehydrorhamnose reductase family protein n=1 Tax=unclassified Pseudoalteromonas TaxID=194690 RepID=UPI00257F9D39|nr:MULTISPECIES: SDR family oxidoreductase [unclassified Pseudoalteromonas]|tara:strand:- start:15613 stop:16485 length:873 start_codon:yes stop_codon:yes gene_type:complete
MRILILGATGMLGYSLFSNLSEHANLSVYGSVRNIAGKERFFNDTQQRLISGVDAYDISSLQQAIKTVAPDVVVNCVGLIKQHGISKQHIDAVKINALLPHELANLCDQFNAKLIHFSTDCVFTGDLGLYNEDSLPDARDLYGKSKCLGEVSYGKHLTLRTSIIGHELTSAVSLVDWFLSQGESTKGFSKAIFSGLPTCYIAKLMVEYILPNPEVSGLLHLSVDPINKYTLLKLIAKQYHKQIHIAESQELVIDRSLNSDKFRQLTHFEPPSWSELVEYMYKDYVKRYKA